MLSIAATLFVGCASSLLAQSAGPSGGRGGVTIPASSKGIPQDVGVRAHTNIQFLSSPGNFSGKPQAYGPPFPGYFYEDPASLACIYNLQPPEPGCNSNVVSLNPQGGSNAIAIVDAYDDPNAYGDLEAFSSQFGVAAINHSSFLVVYAPSGGATPGSCKGSATKPPIDSTGGWELEESLDIEYAHAMAPNATLYLVEAQSDYYTDLLCAVSVASGLVQKAGGGEVSMSWGGGEFPHETLLDAVFTTPGVVYFASAGDGPGTLWPSVSPNVVSAGGTTLSTNPNNGKFIGENTWQDGGGGPSSYESRPSFQNGIVHIVGSQRGTPDVSFEANPYTGVWILDTFLGGAACYGDPWCIVGGTSVSSPNLAGVFNVAGAFSASTDALLTKLYKNGGFGFNDITVGTCGPYIGYFTAPGWDFCSGLGSPDGYSGKR
jgi:subtilase family serine protease